MELDKRGVLTQIVNNRKKIHFLGMLDGPYEIVLMGYNGYDECIDTWDSSAAVWYGLNGIRFDSSPTGTINGKFEKEVDFNAVAEDNEAITNAVYNMNLIDMIYSTINSKLKIAKRLNQTL